MSANSSPLVKGKVTEAGNGGGQTPASLQTPRRYTRAELARYDGTVPGEPVLIACWGKVYDVSGSFPWRRGFHWGYRAGRDLSEALQRAPHGAEMLERVPCVGVLEE